MAPVKFIGRSSLSRGKRLFDILCRLKNFGVGRIVYKNTYNDRYPEPTYYVVTRVDPDMSDPTQASIDKVVPSHAYGHKVFRGVPAGERRILQGYQNDWVLVHRDQEQHFLSYEASPRPVKILPDTIKFPPLMELFISEEQRRAGTYTGETPMLKLKLRSSSAAMTESEAKDIAVE